MNLDPQLIAQILASQETADVGGNGIQRYYTDPATGQRWYGSVQNYGVNGTGDASTVDRSNVAPVDWIARDIPNPDGGKTAFWERYGLDGSFLGRGQYDRSWKDMLQAMMLVAPAVGGIVGAAGGASGATGGAAAAGAGEAAAGGMANGAFLGEGVASGVGAWDAAAINSALGSGQLGTAASYAGQNLSGGTASDTLGSMLNSGNTASNAVNAADVLNTGAKVAGTGLNLGGALGAVAGALSSKDQEQTTSRDPWKPAQPYLEGLLREGADLHGQMKAQPFNGAQQAGYNNMAGLLDLVNKNAGGLLSGFQANASGANQFRRGQPQGLIGSSFNPSPQEWNPQSYGRFGG